MRKLLASAVIILSLTGCSYSGVGAGVGEAPSTVITAEPGTVGQRNALRSAESYLRTMPFSRERLIGQLEYEKYSTEDATWAVDRVKVDWMEQAAKKAASYLRTMAFSRDRLIEQLLYEGFTPEQAEYGVGSVYPK